MFPELTYLSSSINVPIMKDVKLATVEVRKGHFLLLHPFFETAQLQRGAFRRIFPLFIKLQSPETTV